MGCESPQQMAAVFGENHDWILCRGCRSVSNALAAQSDRQWHPSELLRFTIPESSVCDSVVRFLTSVGRTIPVCQSSHRDWGRHQTSCLKLTTCLRVATRRHGHNPDCPDQIMTVYRWVRKPGQGGPAASGAQEMPRNCHDTAKKCAKTCAQHAAKRPQNRFQTDLWVSLVNWGANTVFVIPAHKQRVAQRDRC